MYSSFILNGTEWDPKLTLYWWEDSITKETVPLLSFMGLPAPLWYHSSPVPDGTGEMMGYTVPRLASWWSRHSTKISPSHKSLSFYDNNHWLPYLMPLLMVSEGAQLTASKQSVLWCCLLSRNQPESDSPRTCIPVCPSPSSSSATWSTFRRTPVPPALHAQTWHILRKHLHRRTWMTCLGFWISNHKQNVHTWTNLLPASRRTFALSRLLFSNSFTTSWMISEPMKAYPPTHNTE